MPQLKTWHTPDSIRSWWPGAPKDDDVLADVLETARDRAIRHLEVEGLDVPNPGAPAEADGTVTSTHRLAQAKFARSAWEAQLANVDPEEIGTDPSAVPAFRLELQARQLLGFGTLGNPG